MRIRSILEPPGNFPDFIGELAQGLAGLYGPAAGEVYRRMAPKAVKATMRAREVQTYCAEIEGTAAGLVMALCREECGRIPFIHVLKPYLGKGIEERLLREAVNPLRAGGVTAIASECIPFCDIDLRTPFLAMGFQVFPRQLMRAETQLLSNMGTGVFRSAPCGPLDIRGAAECIAAAYANHGERILHAEVQHADSAGEYIRATLRGSYGASRPEYVRIIRDHDRVAGAILGCEAAPEVGFILQVAVRPDAQNHGLGRTLLGELAACFLKRGMNRTALGVTVANPARGLYLRLGFEPLRDVDAFVWTRP